MEVCHGPNGVDNNSINNLRYDTHKANINEATPTRKDIRAVKCGDGRVFFSITEAALHTGASRSKIVECCRGRRNKSGGLTWSYYENDW